MSGISVLFSFSGKNVRSFSCTCPTILVRVMKNTKNLYLNGELIEELVIPDGVEAIKDSAFWGCTSLISITIPDSITFIGREAFYGCTSLTRVTFENTNGWYVGVAGEFPGMEGIDAALLKDPATAAIYLTKVHNYYVYWERYYS